MCNSPLKREERRITSMGDHQSGTRGRSASLLNAEARPTRAQIDAAKVRLARALQAEDQLKERWVMLEEHVKANQQEKTAAQGTPQVLTTMAKMELERGGEYNHPETALEQILELIETTWPAGEGQGC